VMGKDIDYASAILIADLRKNVYQCNYAMATGDVDKTVRALNGLIDIRDEMMLYSKTSRFSGVIKERIDIVNDCIGIGVFDKASKGMHNGGLEHGA